MKKAVIISLSFNILLIVVIIMMYKNYSFTKNNFYVNNKKDIVKKKIKDNDSIIDKTDPIYIYKSRKFPCDEGTGSSYGYNLCSGERLYLADSLLNEVVKYRLKDFDNFIKLYKEGVLTVKGSPYFIKCLRMSILSKENFIKSQKAWKEMRVLNSEEVSIDCDGVSTCVGIVNNAEIEYVLDRIKKIKNGGSCF
ncbi:hypothetical protein [Flavobacterium tructae]|uniref:hypothetical protein n=1 Tax=Flavobacterium tructae TaxID=1114873 RepID=UPI0035A88F9E